MQPTLIDQGLNLMLFGMGTVFIFLTVLVFATMLMSRIVARFSTPETVAESSSGNNTATPSPQIIAAIRKAIAAHRQA